MSSGFDARVGIAKETTYATRVAPTRFFPLTTEGLDFTPSRYTSPAIGNGMWGSPSIVTSKVGAGPLTGDVPSVGFSFLVDGLHGNTVTPVQIASTPAYTHTHILNTPPSKSYTIQTQMPPVTSSTLVPHDMTGVRFGGMTLSWATDGALAFSIPTVYQNLDTTQSLATYAAPAAYELFSMASGLGYTITIGGSLEGNLLEGGSVEIAYPLRQVVGTGGLINNPVIDGKPTATVSFTADFVDNSQILRVLNETVADVVVSFNGSVISGANRFKVEVTIPDCKFTTPRPGVPGPGPITQAVSATASSATNDPPQIVIVSTETTV